MDNVQLRDFDEIKRDSQAIVDACGKRDEDFQSYENIFKINPDSELGKSAKEGIRYLFDPQGFNAINAAVKMYSSNEPSITVPVAASEDEAAERASSSGDAGPARRDEATEQFGSSEDAGPAQRDEARRGGEKVEQFIRALLYANATVSDRDFFMDSLYSMYLFGELPQITDSPLDELPEEATVEEMQEIDAPYLFWVPSARSCYPRYSRRAGLIQHTYKAKVTAAEIRDSYGSLSSANPDLLQALGAGDQEKTLWDYIDRYQHTVWVEEHPAQPLLNVGIPYGFIPRVSRRGASPGFFEEEEYQRMPLLFGYLKAGLYAASNLLMTVEYNNVLDFSNPVFAVFLKQLANREVPQVDWDKRGSFVPFYEGESIQNLYRGLVPPELINLLSQVMTLSQDSTISRASLGALPTGDLPAAALNIISMASRMATFLGARSTQMACEATFSKMLRRIKLRGKPVVVWGETGPVTLAPSDIGSHYRVRVKFKPDQQVEKQMVAGLVSQLFNTLHLGYDTALEMLEESGIVESASAAFDNMIERALIEAELPALAGESGQLARKLMHVARMLPETPEGPPASPPAPGVPQGMAAGSVR